MKKPFIPFSWWPGSWGLKGKTRQIAQAEYELSGIELQSRLLEINHGDDPKAMAALKLEMEKKLGMIDDYSYDRQKVDISDKEDTEKQISLLEVDLAHGKITKDQHDRKKADLLGEPWVSMPRINWDPSISSRTYFQLDYNEHFLEFLRENGYEGEEDDVVSTWLNDICISIAEEISGLDAEMLTPSRRGDVEDK